MECAKVYTNSFKVISLSYIIHSFQKISKYKSIILKSIYRTRKVPNKNSSITNNSRNKNEKHHFSAFLKKFFLNIGYHEYSIGVVICLLIFIRSFMDVYILTLVTNIEKSILFPSKISDSSINIGANSMKFKIDFMNALFKFGVFCIPMAAVNSLLAYSVNEFALNIRETLSTNLIDKLMKYQNYYRLSYENSRKCQNSISPMGDTPETKGVDQEELFHEMFSSSNIEQILTSDISRFSGEMASLFSHIIKPIIDIVQYSYYLNHPLHLNRSDSSSADADLSLFRRCIPGILSAYLIITGMCINYMRSPTSHYADRIQTAEGTYRSEISYLLSHAEEIALLNQSNGNHNAHFNRNMKSNESTTEAYCALQEEGTILQGLYELVDHMRNFYQFKGFQSGIDNILSKYGSSVLSWSLIAYHYFSNNGNHDDATSGVTTYSDFHMLSKVLMKLGVAWTSLISNSKDYIRCVSIYDRIRGFEQLLDEMNGDMQRHLDKSQSPSHGCDKFESVISDGRNPTCGGSTCKPDVSWSLKKNNNVNSNVDNENTVLLRVRNLSVYNKPFSIGCGCGGDKSTDLDRYIMENQLLIDRLSIDIYRHNNVLVIGPNGGGKSSLFRILAGIMPGLGYINNRNALITPITGEISQQESKENSCICYTHTPPGTDSIGTQPCSFIHPPSVPVLFLPQRAYLTNGGSLRSQILYPVASTPCGLDPHSSGLLYEASLDRMVTILRLLKLDRALLRYKPSGTSTPDHISVDSSDGNPATNEEDRVADDIWLKRILAGGDAGVAGDTNDGGVGSISNYAWHRILSGGEKQTIGLARVLYHQPHLVYLDEATSALSKVIENIFYEECRRVGITVISITHDPNSIMKHHSYVLKLSEISQLNSNNEASDPSIEQYVGYRYEKIQ